MPQHRVSIARTQPRRLSRLYVMMINLQNTIRKYQKIIKFSLKKAVMPKRILFGFNAHGCAHVMSNAIAINLTQIN